MKSSLLVCSSLFLGVAAFGQGLKYERWNNLDGTIYLDSLKKGGIALRAADVSSTTTSAAIPANVANNYGARLSGYVEAPITGDYTFFINGDDQCELLLSPDDSPYTKQRIAWQDGAVANGSWYQLWTQRSAKTFRLTGGQRYYIEGLVKEAAGNDYLNIGWAYEAPIEKTVTALGTVGSHTWTESNGAITASVDAGDIYGTADSGSFNGRPWTGDGEVTCRITRMNNPIPWAKAGLMIRAGLDANSANAMLERQPGAGITFQRRRTNGGASTHNTVGKPDIEANPWLRLIRMGETISAYYSLDGVNWLGVGSDTFPGLPATLYVGMAATDWDANAHVPVEATFEEFSVRKYAPSAIIPGSALTPYAGHANDQNANGLPDDFESGQNLTGDALAVSQYGDPDGDGVSNLLEYQFGTSPTSKSGTPGQWSTERWVDTGFVSVDQLVNDSKFYGPATVKAQAPATSFRAYDNYDAARLRATITAPVTGDYVFWLSAAGSSELWLSSDATPFQKKRIARLSPVIGTTYGVYVTDANVWDHFDSQMSQPVHLEAGQSYYIEALAQSAHQGNNHITLAWAKPGGARERIPFSAVTSYGGHDADAQDDDSLPDAWEVQYGLSPADNGYVDLQRQGQNGDFDLDGLSNLVEYQLGTAPNNADSDGDGIPDGVEARGSSNPLVSDAPSETVAGTIDLPAYVSSSYHWLQLPDGLISDTFRGGIEWDFNVPSNGVWIVQLDTLLKGALNATEQIPMRASIDGIPVGKETLTYGRDAKALWRLITPYLAQGTHRFRLDIDNVIARRIVMLRSIQLRQPTGADADNNGIPDWIEAKLAAANGIAPYSPASKVSPAFIEGNTRIPSLTSLSSNSQSLTLLRGRSDHHWFGNVPLAASGSTPFTVAYGDSPAQNGAIEWEPTDVLLGGSIRIRVGDSLKLAAHTGDPNGTAQINASGTLYNVTGAQSATRTFTQAGNFTVTATHSSGVSGTLTVQVRKANFTTPFDVAMNQLRTWTLQTSAIDHDLFFESGDGLRLTELNPTQTTKTDLQLYPAEGGQLSVLARLSQNGPIVGVGPVNSIVSSDAMQNDLATRTPSQTQPGYSVVTTPMVVTGVPTGGRVVVTIFRAGIMFEDGTTVKTFTAAEVADGLVFLKFLMPDNMVGGYCHYVDIYDRNGTLISRR